MNARNDYLPEHEKQERLVRANAAIIRYPRFKELHETIRHCRDISKLAGEPQCMSLEGVPGAGKTTLIREYAAAFPRIETPNGDIITIFYMETPAPVTIKGLAAVMLKQLGDPAADRGTLWSMNSRLVNLIIACRVELVILDDFHHLIDIETNRVLLTVSEWLKVLIKETGVPFLVVGIEGKVELILKGNSQLSRLFAAREVLRPFTWDVSVPKTIQEFDHFVQYAERAIGIPIKVPFARVDFLYRLHYATDGVVANIMNLLREAQVRALKEQKEDINLADLEEGFKKRLEQHMPGHINPFTAVEASFVEPPQPLSDAQSATEPPVPQPKRRGKSKATAPGVKETAKLK